MEEKSELNDIILNKGSGSANSKKVLMAIATFAIVLIIVIVIMNVNMSSSSNSYIDDPQRRANEALNKLNENMQTNPPQDPAIAPDTKTVDTPQEDPLFVPVPIVEEKPATDDNIDKIAQKLKEQSAQEPEVVVIEEPKAEPVKTAVTTPKTTVAKGTYYVQVGSFAKYQPDKKFLNLITKNGYKYSFHKEKNINKVLIGPYQDEKSAREALKQIRKTIKKDAFLKKV